jgi:phage/plasmid-associated DNA primase
MSATAATTRIALKRFLEAHRLKKDSTKQATHVGYGDWLGNFRIVGTGVATFMKLYEEHIITNPKVPPTLLEKPLELEGLKIDLDFRHQLPADGEPTRIVTTEMLHTFSEAVCLAAMHFFTCNDLHCIITQRPSPYVEPKGRYLKDGAHFNFPELKLTTEQRVSFRRAMLCEPNVISKCFPDVEFINTPEDIIDERVLNGTNSWFLYGSAKPGMAAYEFVASTRLDEEGTAFITDTEEELLPLVYYLSNRAFEAEPAVLTETGAQVFATMQPQEAAAEADPEQAKPAATAPHVALTGGISDKDFATLKRAVSCWSAKRATEYQTWMKAALCIYSVCKGDLRADALAEEFSAKAGPKYEAGSILKFKRVAAGRIGMGSAIRWAHEDSPARADELFGKPLHATGMHDDDFALHFQRLHGAEFLYNEDNSSWYSYNGVYWKKDPEALALSSRLTYVFKRECLEALPEEQKQKPTNTAEENEKVGEANKMRTAAKKRIEKQLGDSLPKRGIITALKDLLVKPASIKFDKHRHLYAFENEVFDLHMGKFIDPKPEQYVSKTCGYEWPFGRDGRARDDDVAEVLRIITDMFPSTDDNRTRDFMLQAMAQCLEGINRSEKVFFLTGRGRNGKTLLLNMLEAALGAYYGTMELEYLTTDEKHANSAKSQLVALADKRGIATHEPDGGARTPKIRNSKLKPLAGRDTITARQLYSEVITEFEFAPLFILCNQLPDFTNPDDPAIGTKPIVIPFTQTFVHECDYEPGVNKLMDESLKEKVRATYRVAVMQLLFDEYAKYRSAGFKLNPPKEIAVATSEYREEISAGKAWAKSVLIRDSSADTSIQQLLQAWNEHNRETNPDWRNVDARAFGKSIRAWGYDAVERGKAKVKVIAGYRLVVPVAAADEPAPVDPPAFDEDKPVARAVVKVKKVAARP